MHENPKEADENVPAYAESHLIDPNSLVSRVLRELYDSVQNEAIPERFLDLLEKLDMAENAAKAVDTP
jgi:hypothetical protein